MSVESQIREIVKDPYIQIKSPEPAYKIETEQEAIEIAQRLAREFAQNAVARDRERRLPIEELNEYSQSGLWALTVPKEYGGLGASYRTVGEVFKIISSADSSLGQLPQNHYVILAHLNLDASEEQKRFFFDLALSGVRYGNAFSERSGKHVADFKTILHEEDHFYTVSGDKFFCTGALLAHWIPIVAVDSEGRPHLAFAPRDAAGVTVINDWSSFGQKTTASGTVILHDVRIKKEHVVPIWKAFARPTAGGCISQFIQAAIDAGLARGALQDTLDYVRQYTRPWIDSGLKSATEDPYIIQQIGDIQIRLRAAEAVLDLAANAIDKALLDSSEENVATATLRTAEAKVLTTEVAILASNKLFELAGTRSTLEEYGLDRHWRNARVHTLHDPVRWKYHIIGNYVLNGVNPPRHPWS